MRKKINSKTYKIGHVLEELTYWKVEGRNGYYAIDEYLCATKACIKTVVTGIPRLKAATIVQNHNLTSKTIQNILLD